MNLLGTGMYPLTQAARLVGADVRKVRRWMLGYDWTHKGGGEHRHSEPLWRTELAGEDLPGDVIGFRDLLELRLVAAFAQHGVSLITIRATANAAREYLNSDYPLTTKRFLTDGRRIFMEAVASTGEPHVMDLARKQFVFREIIKPSLYAGIDYDADKARRWFPLSRRKTIVLDPAVQFGNPVVRRAGVPTDTIYASYLAEGKDRAKVARLFEISPAEVADAVAFEQSLAH
jgi:uncharacterized protein (DUF433 family)